MLLRATTPWRRLLEKRYSTVMKGTKKMGFDNGHAHLNQEAREKLSWIARRRKRKNGKFAAENKTAATAPTPAKLVDEKKTDSSTSNSSNGVPLNNAYDIYQSNMKQEGRAKILSREEYKSTLLDFGIEENLAEKAAHVLANKPPILIATSGKLASGKDTIALEFVKTLGVNDQHHLSFAAPLKDEAQEVLNTIRSSTSPEDAVEKIIEFNVPRDRAEYIVEVAYEGAHNEPNVNTRDRTPWVRTLLQYWGVEVRRHQDPNYWRNKAVLAAVDKISDGTPIIVTDARYPAEVEALQAIGFTVIRLSITPETQANRLNNRDGLPVDPKALVHETETALDNFEGFNIVIDNNETSIEETVANIAAKFN